MKNLYNVVLALLLLCSFTCDKNAALDDSFATLKKLRIHVLNENIIGKHFYYDLTHQKDCNKTKITYLGRVVTTKNRHYKLLNSFWVAGPSCRGISRLVIYDTNNTYLGNYYFEGPLPYTLINNSIAFKPSEEYSKNEIRISFKNRLPKNFEIGIGGTIRFQGWE